MNFGTAIERRASDSGTAAWLRILVVALLIALAVPALAMADDGGAAVLDPPATQADTTADPAAEATPTEPAAEQPPADVPAAEPVPAAEAPVPVADAPPAEPPAATPPVVTIPVVTIPVLDIPVEVPTIPAAGDLPAVTPPAAGEPVPAPVPGSAPEIPELVPGPDAATPVTLPPLTAPAEPPAIHLVAAAPPATPPAATPPVSGAADALGIPNSPPAITIGPPQTPGFTALLAQLRRDRKDLVAGATNTGAMLSTDLFGRGRHQGGLTSVTAGAAGAGQSVIDLARRGEEPTFGFTVEMAVPVGPAPSGSSLLAVLAGYVLPGSSGPPASTLVMLIVIGLILGVGYAARPELTEALASANLMGASSGHGMAVRRPG